MLSRLVLLSLFTTGCIEDVGKDKVKAEIVDDKPATEAPAKSTNDSQAMGVDATTEQPSTDNAVANDDATPSTEGTDTPATDDAAIKTTTVAVNQSKSSINALSAKVSATHPIEFPAFSGEVKLQGDKLSGVSFKIEMASLKSDNERLTKHLLNEDFFDVPKFPHSTFSSKSIEAKAGVGGTTHEITGDLTIIGNTKTIKFPATVAVNDSTVTANTEFTINRQDFGVSYKGRADDLVQDNVVLTISLAADR